MAKKKPKRMCVSCRDMIEKKDLIRVVITSEGQAWLDDSGKKPGRGAYVCRNKDCLTSTLRENKLERSLKAKLDAAVRTELENIMESLPDES